MDFRLTDEQAMLRESAIRYLAEHHDFDQRRALIERDGGFSETLWRQFAGLGWLALPLPADCGGLAGSFIDVSLVMEALGGRLVLEPYATTAVLSASLIDAADDDGLRRELIERIAAGEVRVALAHAERGARYDLGQAGTRARRCAGGFELIGQKVTVWDAASAHYFIVSAVIDGEKEFSLFVVARDAAGLERHVYRLIDATQCADLDFAAVPARLLVPAPAALGRLDAAVDRLLLARVAEALGIMEQLLLITAEHLHNRSQFGRPLATCQSLQHRMAEMFVETQQVRSILYRGLAYIDAPAEERNLAVSAAKVVANGAGRIVGGESIQLHGGVGITDEYPVGHYFKRLLTLEKGYGDTSYHLDRLANSYRGSRDPA